MEKLIIDTDNLTLTYKDDSFEIPIFNILNEEQILSHINIPVSIEGETPLSLKVLSALLKKYGVFQFLFPHIRDFLLIAEEQKPKLYLVDNVINLRDKRKEQKEKHLFECLLLEKRNIIQKVISEQHELISLNTAKNTLLMGSKIISEEIDLDKNDLYALNHIEIEEYFYTPIYMCMTNNSLHEKIVFDSGKERDHVYKYCDMKEKITLYEMLEGIMQNILIYPEEKDFLEDEELEKRITDSINIIKFRDDEEEENE